MIHNEFIETIGKLGFNHVPVIGEYPISWWIDFVSGHPLSNIYNERYPRPYMEGVVIKPTIGLLDAHGERIICKVKWREVKSFVT